MKTKTNEKNLRFYITYTNLITSLAHLKIEKISSKLYISSLQFITISRWGRTCLCDVWEQQINNQKKSFKMWTMKKFLYCLELESGARLVAGYCAVANIAYIFALFSIYQHMDVKKVREKKNKKEKFRIWGFNFAS